VSSAHEPGFFGRHANVYLYVPNLIGYFRVVLAAVSLAYAFDNMRLSLVAYFLSFVCDELDGRFARKFNQCSELGKLLDMVTDRLATAGLLMVLSREYPAYFYHCMALVLLDIASHWLQMYSQLLANKTSHKDVDTSAFVLLRLYYTNRIFMGVCCVSAEVLYLAMHAATDAGAGGVGSIKGPLPAGLFNWLGALREVPAPVPGGRVGALGLQAASATAVGQLAFLMFPGWVVKQVANVAQLWGSCQALVAFDFPPEPWRGHGKKSR